VLLVDDDEPIRTPLKELLESEGYRVVTAANGRDALRSDPELHAIPVIILSAWLHRWTARMVDSEHMQVLPKPIDTDRLLTLVRGYCGERRREFLSPSSETGKAPKS